MTYQQSWKDQKHKPKIRKNTDFKYRKHTKFNPLKLILKKEFLKLIIILGFLGLFVGFIGIMWLSRGLPNPNQLLNREVVESTKIYDRTGEHILYDIHGDEQRTLIKLKDLPNYVKWATISIEDKNFYEHKGISIWGILRGVVWQTVRGRRIQGGSTLTQQFVKNAILTSQRSISRKVKEWILAYRMEKRFSKDEILQMYLNEIPYGSTAYGIEAASRRYFSKSAKDLTLAQASLLASLPQAPSLYSPYGSHKKRLIIRQHYVLTLMAEQGYITEEEAEKAKNEELIFSKPSLNITAPHFVMYIKELLTKKYGEKMIEQGGLKIYTTLDLYKQKIAEEVITEKGEINVEKWEASNASLVSIDPKTGEVLAMVGSKDYFNDKIDGQVNITTSLRQPGSSMKPLVYASMFDLGYNSNTILYDVDTNFSTEKNKTYEPKNYDLKQHGPVSIRKALAGSLNIPAVKGIYLAGVDNVIKFAKELGYSSLEDKDRFGLSLVLGGAEIKLLEHTNAFSGFAREGEIQPITVILKIEDRNGKTLEEWKKKKPKKVFKENVAKMINDILSDNSARAYAFGEHNWLTLGKRPVAAKTGTTNDYRDAWTIGYTPSLVTGVWVGNNDNSKMKRGAAGGVVAAPIWHDYMEKVLGDTPIEEFKKPKIEKTGKSILDGEISIGQKIKIDKLSGLLATEFTPPEYIEEVSFMENHSILYYVNKKDPLGESPKNPEKDSQFKNWEEGVLRWVEAEKEKATSSSLFSTSTPPIEFDDIHTFENKPTIKIIKPKNNSIITNGLLSTKIKTNSKRGIKEVNYYINNILLIKKTNSFYNLDKEKINFLNNGYHNLKIEACDDVKNCSSKSIEFNLILDKENDYKDFKTSLISPNSGLAISNIDFPLPFKFQVENEKQIAKIEILSIINNKTSLIKTIQPINSSFISTTWDITPTTGTYKIFFKTYSWNGDIKESEPIFLSITNLNKSSE